MVDSGTMRAKDLPLSPRRRVHPIVWGVAGVIAVAGWVFANDYWQTIPSDTVASFVGRDSCAQCHQGESVAFHGSHHDLAMDLATDESVLADFNNATIEHDGMTSRMFRDGTRFMIHTDGPDGEMQDFEIKYVFGVDPLQQYMVEFDRDPDAPPDVVPRVQVLRISWDTRDKKWFYLRPPDVKEKLKPDDPLHWTGIAQRWQTMCADCHSTNLKTNFDVATTTYRTTFSEIDVSCEACHGPGSTHVELASTKRLFWDRNVGFGLNRLKGDDTEPQLQTCAHCHSRRGMMNEGFTGGADFHNHYELELLQPETYFDDGQIKDEVYAYGSFVQSKMYHKDIRCTDCHDPHTLKLKHPGNETCTSCHQHPAGKYDVPSHHHHAAGTDGAKCVNCHMAGRTYMDVDFRRDHSFRVPRPDLSVKIGTPNACTDCHLKDQIENVDPTKRDELKDYADWLDAASAGGADILALIQKTDAWCDDACEKWYGADRKKPEHFGETFAAFRRGEPGAVQRMLKLAMRRDETSADIVRATAMDNLAFVGANGCSATAMRIMKDTTDHPRVRAASIGCLQDESPASIQRALIPLLGDTSTQVRTAAARGLASSPVYGSLSLNERTRVDIVLKEIEVSLKTMADRASAHLSWGSLCEQRGKLAEAIQAYEYAIRVEPNAAGSRSQLASLLDSMAQPGDEKAAARSATLRAEELPLLARDAKLAPTIAVVQYRYGLALYLSGDKEASLERLRLATELDPSSIPFKSARMALEADLKKKN